MSQGNKNVVLIMGAPNTGKAQPLYSEIKSPLKTKLTFGNVQVGSPIYGEDGNVYAVTAVHEQGLRNNFLVEFNDGTTVECCNDHLWTFYRSPHSNGGGERSYTASLQDLLDTSYKGIYFKLPKPLMKAEVAHYIHPYLLGVLLADGYLTGNSVEISSAEPSIVNYLNTLTSVNGYAFSKSKGANYNYVLKAVDGSSGPNPYIRECKRLGIFGKYSYEKEIPQEYLDGSVSQRLALLRGLFDCDGSVSLAKTNSASRLNYSTTSTGLCNTLKELLGGLGYRFSVRKDLRDKYTSGVCYEMYIKNVVDRPIVFSSDKHTGRFTQSDKLSRRAIKSITALGCTPMRCISTSNPTKLYLTDNFVVTHNTACLRALKEQENMMYLNFDLKELSFSKDRFRKKIDVPDALQVLTFIDQIEAHKESTGAVVDTLTFAMQMYERQYVAPHAGTAKGQQAWGDYFNFYSNMLHKIKSGTKDYIILAHDKAEFDPESGNTLSKVPVKGAVGRTGVKLYSVAA